MGKLVLLTLITTLFLIGVTSAAIDLGYGDNKIRVDIDQQDVNVNINSFTGNLTNLSQLQDVDITSPSINDTLIYNGSSWINQAISLFRWVFATTQNYIYEDGDGRLNFNETLLNATIDARSAGGGAGAGAPTLNSSNNVGHINWTREVSSDKINVTLTLKML